MVCSFINGRVGVTYSFWLVETSTAVYAISLCNIFFYCF